MRLTVIGTPEGTRAGLVTMLARLREWQLIEEDLGTVEIVMAEALNNIVEHALADAAGDITVAMSRAGGFLNVEITDPGNEMPGGTTPLGRGARLDVAKADLPEGGFGWNLIHMLTEDLSYGRSERLNHLSFSIRLAG